MTSRANVSGRQSWNLLRRYPGRRASIAFRVAGSSQKAREDIAAFPPSVTAYAIAYDGFLTVQGTKFDAILVEASERGRPVGVRMAQRYTPKKLLRSFQTVGNPALLGECETLLR